MAIITGEFTDRISSTDQHHYVTFIDKYGRDIKVVFDFGCIPDLVYTNKVYDVFGVWITTLYGKQFMYITADVLQSNHPTKDKDYIDSLVQFEYRYEKVKGEYRI